MFSLFFNFNSVLISRPAHNSGLAKAARNILRTLNFPLGSLRQAAKRYMKCLADVFQLKIREGKTKRKKPPHF
jgi:hypothetical protein